MKKVLLLFLIALGLLLNSCKQQSSEETVQTPLVSVKTTNIVQGDIESNIHLNGKTIFLQKNKILSPIAGYIIKIDVKTGDKVKKNDVLFEIQTKENKALENTDALSKNQGVIQVRALSSGIIDELNVFETGIYVLEGDLLCNIIENSNLIVQVNVPFEYNALLKNNLNCKIILPDQTSFNGVLYRILPSINESDQTQTVWIKPVQNSVLTSRHLPENLNLTVEFVWTKHNNALLVSKSAVMTNETQSEFWMMKLTDQNVAIKVPIQKGIEKDNIVEIVSENLKKNDVVISEGAYGLTDSTVVKIDN